MKCKHSAYGLLVDDIDSIVRFYRDVYGYRVIRQSDTFAQVETGGPLKLFFWKWSHLCQHLGEDAMKKVRHRTQSALQFENPEDVDRAYIELLDKGVCFVSPPGNWEWNARAAYFVDTDGYMWELYCWL
jgi:catechol 2,3-dioxygenase-like lactoylglutathione lyase family enzyme